MGIAKDAARALGKAMHNVHAGDEKLLAHELAAGMEPRIQVRSPAFTDGAPLPTESTVDGVGTPPRIEWSDAPADAKSIALVCEDPDAPMTAPYVHWIVYGLAASRGSGAIEAKAKSGKNSKLTTGFTPAAPPRGHGVHHYHFQVFALDQALDVAPGLGRGQLADKMRGHIVGWGELIGTYQRN